MIDRVIVWAAANRLIDNDKYPNVKKVCDLFDVTVMTDLVDEPFHTVYFLGTPADHSAGLYRSELTDYFDSMEELEAFCAEHYAKFVKLSDDENVNAYDIIHSWR